MKLKSVPLLLALVILVLWLQVELNWVGLFTADRCEGNLCCSDCRQIRVTRIIDGDTFVSPSGTIRLFGVDTPEYGEPCFVEATARLRQLSGSSVKVEKGPRGQDRYGRLLFYTYTQTGESIDETLIRDGLGLAWTRDGQHLETLMEIEQRARESGVGCLW